MDNAYASEMERRVAHIIMYGALALAIWLYLRYGRRKKGNEEMIQDDEESSEE
jgi:hypothetical protein